MRLRRSVLTGAAGMHLRLFSGSDGLRSGGYFQGGYGMAISKDLLDILACPKCKGDIHLNTSDDGLICEACRLVYPIKDDIPIMLIDEAVPL
jgi:uncharacterized protein YbaR (Trm112 family)